MEKVNSFSVDVTFIVFVPMRGGIAKAMRASGRFIFYTNQGEDVLILGKAYHNNHHKYPSSVNFGSVRWHEVDPIYPVILLLHWLHIIRIKDLSFKRVEVEF